MTMSMLACGIAGIALLVNHISAAPTDKIIHAPIPDETTLYSSYLGKSPPFPGTITNATLPTSSGPPAIDDVMWQNLLSAEWIVFSFYQQGIEKFNTSSFTDIGLPNNTYDRLAEIRDNEAGHLETFYSQISNASTKAGPCKYEYGFETAYEFLVLQVLIEVSSMAFATGLVQQAKVLSDIGAGTAVGEVESRHTAWALMDVWGEDPFSGPMDTTYGYTNQIYQVTKQFEVAGSCPAGNPPYPNPSQDLPPLSFNTTISSGHPGEKIQFIFPKDTPSFEDGRDYYAVFNHGIYNITMPFNHKTGMSEVPAQFESGKGIILATIADTRGAPTEKSVLAGPIFLIQQPSKLTPLVYSTFGGKNGRVTAV